MVDLHEDALLLYETLAMIPYGRVTWYGYLADYLSVYTHKRRIARRVGSLLSQMPASYFTSYPRHRVVAKSGVISSLKLGEKGLLQIASLEREGVEVRTNRVAMNIYGRAPPI